MKLYTLALVWLFPVLLIGQVIRNIHIAGGYVAATQTVKGKKFPQSIDGFGLQACITHIDKRHFAFQTVYGYTQKGSQMQKALAWYKYSLQYLSFSPQAVYKLPFASVTPYIFGGPRLDGFINGRLEYENNGTVYKDQSNMREYNRFVFGLSYGIGVEKRIKALGLGLLAQHFYDVSHASGIYTAEGYRELERKNSALAVYASLKYYFSKG